MMLRPMILCAFLLPMPVMASDLTVLDAWVPLAPPTASTHAAYISVHNRSDQARVLVGISSDSFVITYIHESKEVDGVVAMSMLHQIEIPAGGTLMMKPGGLHVMLMGATGSVLNGDVIPLRLEFANGESLAVDAMVKPRDNQS